MHSILVKSVDDCSPGIGRFDIGCEDTRDMRSVIILSALFLYVCADITANRGASVRGWLSMLASTARAIGLPL
jgi:hypothetical protein